MLRFDKSFKKEKHSNALVFLLSVLLDTCNKLEGKKVSKILQSVKVFSDELVLFISSMKRQLFLCVSFPLPLPSFSVIEKRLST